MRTRLDDRAHRHLGLPSGYNRPSSSRRTTYTMADVQVDTVRLIDLVKSRPQLWDRSLRSYKERRSTRESWDIICEAVDPTYHTRPDNQQAYLRDRLLKRWTNVRDCWIRAYKREMDCTAGEPRPKRYIYFRKMMFLTKIFDQRRGDQCSTGEQTVDLSLLKVEPPEELTSHCPSAEEDERPMSSSEELCEPSLPEESMDPMAFSWPAFQEVPDNRARERRQVTECESTAQKMPRGEEDPTLMFFKGVLPLVREFNNDQMIDFQIGVLQLIKNINEKSR